MHVIFIRIIKYFYISLMFPLFLVKMFELHSFTPIRASSIFFRAGCCLILTSERLAQKNTKYAPIGVKCVMLTF